VLVVADSLLENVKQFDATLELKYNKHYIGLGKDGAAFNFVSFRPKKSTNTLEIKLPQTDDVNAKIEQAGLDALEYSARWSTAAADGAGRKGEGGCAARPHEARV
jgi:hypothetical protein